MEEPAEAATAGARPPIRWTSARTCNSFNAVASSREGATMTDPVATPEEPVELVEGVTPAAWEKPRVVVIEAKAAEISEGLNPEGKAGLS
jgi:hypothetical protein